MYSIMWKPKYFHTMTTRIAYIASSGSASTCGGTAPNTVQILASRP